MSAKKDYSCFPPAVRFPPGIDNHAGYCDYCNRYRPTAHVRITEASPETWFLCVLCIRANHTDAEVQAVVDERERTVEEARRVQEAAQAAAAVPKPYIPEPFSRQWAIDRLITDWNHCAIDDRQCERLCAAVHAGQYDDEALFNRALKGARWKHVKRMHTDFGAYNPWHHHPSGLSVADRFLTLDSSPMDLRTLIRQLDETLALPADPAWKPEENPDWPYTWDARITPDGKQMWIPTDYAERCALLKRLYFWRTGRAYTPYTIETARLEKEAS